jgi:hypothetical protein
VKPPSVAGTTVSSSFVTVTLALLVVSWPCDFARLPNLPGLRGSRLWPFGRSRTPTSGPSHLPGCTE